MTVFPKAAISGAIVVASDDVGAQHIPFQFNPSTVKREITPQAVGGEPNGHSQLVRLTGAAVEIVTIEIEIDALNPLPNQAQSDKAVTDGITPALAALEGIVYPTSDDVIAVQKALAGGTLQVAPYVAPMVLLVLGRNRVLPIDPQSYSIIEQQFDSALNPIRAVISLVARVLTYSDLVPDAAAAAQFLAFQQRREILAKTAFVQGMP